ncbi:MAG: regulatory protein LysR:LysR, substrate-binding protein [Ramlibacter sp.]|nr:regulatory protein LysR:LysR, substrate-binding protein [Ramlibacter sp.]
MASDLSAAAPPARIHFDLTTLRLFIATAELGGVTKAAERVHLAPAAASRRIQEFEAQFQLPLFKRLPHGMALTDAGRALLAHARTMIHTTARMQDDAASYLHGERGVVRIAACKSVVLQFLPIDIQRCAQACPGVRIDLQEMNSHGVLQAMARGLADLGIYESSLGPTDMPTSHYRDDRLVVVTSRQHPLAGRASVELEDILAWDVIALEEGSAISISLERQASEAGRVLRMPIRVGSFDSMAAMIAQGIGIGVMPKGVAQWVARGAVFSRLPIEGAWASRSFVLCHPPAGAVPTAAQSVVQVLLQSPSANPA